MEKYDNLFSSSGESDYSEESVAAWLDGDLDPEADSAFIGLLSSDARLAEILDAYDDVESVFENLIEDGYEIPPDFNFDFMLPEIDMAAEEDRISYHYDSYGEYEEALDSPDMKESDGESCESIEIFDESNNIQLEDMDFF